MAFEKRDYQKSEGLLLRAQRPELAVKFYKVSDEERGGEWGYEPFNSHQNNNII